MPSIKPKVYIAGHNGMVGSATLKVLQESNKYAFILKSSKELDLRDASATNSFFAKEKPDIVIMAAAKVGGIQANIDAPADFLFDNLLIQSNLIEACRKYNVEFVVNIGSSCIYPRLSPQPMKEEYLLDGKLEPTNEGYALAKITGLKLLSYYKKQYGLKGINLMPCNLYGENDSFDLNVSHVLSALVKRFSDAVQSNSPTITLWGTGSARREFMNVRDLARAIEHFLEDPFNEEHLNIGWGVDISIKELAQLIAKKTGYIGRIIWDEKKPDGMPRKCLDVTRMKEYGFEPSISLEEGIDQMIKIYNSI